VTIDKNLIQRTLAGLVFLAVMIFCICFGSVSVSILFTALGILGTYELVQMVSTKTGAHRHKYVTMAVVAVLSVYLTLECHTQWFSWWAWIWIPLLPFAGIIILFLLPNNIEGRLIQAGTFFWALLYVVTPFLLMTLMVQDTKQGYQYFYLLYLFALVWTNDTMAYVCGRLLGRTKLAPEISPKKTWEGFIGGIIFTVVISYVVFYALGWPLNQPLTWQAPLAVSIFATIGDLFESAIKRWAGIKDSGNLIPGHGGILDRFDGAIFAVWPYLYIIKMGF